MDVVSFEIALRDIRGGIGDDGDSPFLRLRDFHLLLHVVNFLALDDAIIHNDIEDLLRVVGMDMQLGPLFRAAQDDAVADFREPFAEFRQQNIVTDNQAFGAEPEFRIHLEPARRL